MGRIGIGCRVVVALGLLAAGCGGFRQLPVGTGDGGTCTAPVADPITCHATKARGFEPLGAASEQSIRAALAPTADNRTIAVWEVAGAHAGAPPGDGGKVYGAPVDLRGSVGNTTLLVDGGTSPQLVRANGVLHLFWLQNGAVMRQELSDDVMLLNQPEVVFDGTADYFSVAWTGSELGVLLQGASGDPYQLYWLRLDGSGNRLAGPVKLAEANSINSIQPALAWTGCLYAAAWTDTRMGTPAVYAALFDADFSRRTPDTLVSAAGVRGSFPAIAAQPTGGVVICHEQLMGSDNQEIFCSRMDLTGTITNTQQLSSTSTPSQNPWLAPHGQNLWVLWDDYLASAQVPGVVWSFLDENGEPINADPIVDPDITPGGWRATGYATADALYFVQYYGNDPSGQFTAQVVTENCY